MTRVGAVKRMRLKRARLTVLLAVSGVLLAAVQLASSNSNKLCCDPDCSRKYGGTIHPLAVATECANLVLVCAASC